jgi:hypothetical protein
MRLAVDEDVSVEVGGASGGVLLTVREGPAIARFPDAAQALLPPAEACQVAGWLMGQAAAAQVLGFGPGDVTCDDPPYSFAKLPDGSYELTYRFIIRPEGGLDGGEGR